MNPNENPIVNNNVPPITPTVNIPPHSPVNNNHKRVGPIIAILVIVLVLIIAALYLFASRINQQIIPNNTESSVTDTSAVNNETATVNQSVQEITNTSDDLQSLQDDLNASTNELDIQNF